MQKKLLALAVAGVLSAPLAVQAQNVQIYGQLTPSFDIIDNGDESGNFIQDNNSRLGFKGSEDLGGGLKAIFQVESRVNFDERGDGGGRWVNRDSWVGFAGGFGSITVGNHQSAYVRSTARLDPFADTIGDYNNIMSVYNVGELDFNDRFRNSVYYTSPKFGGFQVLASYALKGEGFDDDPNPGDDHDDDNTYSIAGTWSSGAFSLTAAYEKQGGVDNDPSAWKIGGSWKVLPTTTLYAMVDRVDSDVSDWDERMGYYIAAKHSIGNIDLLANFMVARDSDRDDDGAKAFSLGVNYNFSKRTWIGAYYAQVDNDDNGQYGMDSGGYEPAAAGDKVKGFSIKLGHKF